jgi:hypothetical protein
MLHLLANRVANALCVRPHQAAALRLFEIKCAWFTEQREKIERPGEPARSNVVNLVDALPVSGSRSPISR